MKNKIKFLLLVVLTFVMAISLFGCIMVEGGTNTGDNSGNNSSTGNTDGDNTDGDNTDGDNTDGGNDDGDNAGDSGGNAGDDGDDNTQPEPEENNYVTLLIKDSSDADFSEITSLTDSYARFAISVNAYQLEGGNTLTITFDDKETSLIMSHYVESVTIDGVVLKLDANSSVSYVIPADATEVSIVVATSETLTTSVSGTLLTDGHTSPIDYGAYVPEGAVVSIYTSKNTLYTTVSVGKNGVVTFDALSDSNYTLLVDGFRTAAFATQGRECAFVKTLVYETFKDTALTDEYIANGYSLSKGGFNYFNDSDIIYAEMTVKAPADSVVDALSSQRSGQIIGFQTTEEKTATYGIVDNDGLATTADSANYKLRWASGALQKWFAPTDITPFANDFYPAYKAGELKIAVFIKNGYAWAMMGVGDDMYYDDCWTLGNISNIIYVSSDFTADYGNIRFARSIDALPNLGYGVFTTEYQGFNEHDGWTATKNTDGSYDIEGTCPSTGRFTSKQTCENKYMTSVDGDTKYNSNGYLITEKTQVSFDIEMSINANDGGTVGWWVQFYFGGAWTSANLQFCAWNAKVYAKNATVDGMKPDALLSNGATCVVNDGTITFKFSGVIKADENGYLAMYNSQGTLIFTTANVGTAYKMIDFNNFYVGCGAEGTTGTFKINNLKVTI